MSFAGETLKQLYVTYYVKAQYRDFKISCKDLIRISTLKLVRKLKLALTQPKTASVFDNAHK